MTPNLTIERIEETIDYLKNPAAHIGRKEGLAAYEKLLATMQCKAKLREAVVLAARWFKLNLDDETFYKYPPSKADLSVMFDAMQEARSEYPETK